MRIDGNIEIDRNRYVQTAEWEKEKLLNQMKEEVWKQIEPFVHIETETEGYNIKMHARLDVFDEMQQFACQDDHGYYMQPMKVLYIKPVIK